MENAAENIVRVYLESLGYVVKTNHKFYYKQKIKTKRGYQHQRTPIEVDILALKGNDKILGEVKTWFGSQGTSVKHFRRLSKKYNPKEDKFKVINNSRIRKALFKAAEKEYGKGFRYVLFLGKFKGRTEKRQIIRYIKKLKFNGRPLKIKEFDEIMDKIIEYVQKSRREYNNDWVLQTVKILNFYRKLNLKNDFEKGSMS